jgi:flagellar biosynthesis protein FlhF
VDQSAQLTELQAELADMRLLLEQQLERLSGEKSIASDSPILASVARRLERLGLPRDVITKVINACTKTKSLSEAWPDALANLAHQLPVSGRDVVDQGGVFAFVGPTGSGKTTTIGKLAARYVLQHGADKVALITTDTYRIAAHDQLRSLARILRVPVRVVDEANPLDAVLRSLRHCSLVLIDTAGFRHGDPHLKAQLKALADQQQVKTYLVMSSNSQAQMLKASVHAYGAARLQGCILTKLDETASIGEALGVVMQSRLPLAYTTDGQDIPKNLDVARGHQLVAKAAALLKANPATAVS